MREERVVLKDHADTATMRGKVDDRLVAELDIARRWQLETCDQLQKSGLAGTRRAEQRDELSNLNP